MVHRARQWAVVNTKHRTAHRPTLTKSIGSSSVAVSLSLALLFLNFSLSLALLFLNFSLRRRLGVFVIHQLFPFLTILCMYCITISLRRQLGVFIVRHLFPFLMSIVGSSVSELQFTTTTRCLRHSSSILCMYCITISLRWQLGVFVVRHLFPFLTIAVILQSWEM
jgi:hypothetical protein